MTEEHSTDSLSDKKTYSTDNVVKDNIVKDTVINKNRFQPNSKYFTIMIYGLMFILLSIVLFKLIGGFAETMKIIGNFIDIVSPFIVGAFIAFILYPLVRFFQRKFFFGTLKIKSDKAAKWLALILTYIVAIGVIAILLVFIIPQIYKSISDIINQLPVWYQNVTTFINNFESNHADWTFVDYNVINQQLESLYPKIIDYLTGLVTNLMPYVVNTSIAILKGIVNFIISIMVSIYMISDHKNIFFHFKRLLYAVFPIKKADKCREIGKQCGHIFLNFMYGKALDSLIIGIICFICMIIFRFPYAVLISVIVGITNMIPYFGPYIGGILGGIIIVIVNPIQVIFFAIMILVIQQFDGLFLGPKILGDSTGLKPLWVIFAIVVGGGLFGVLGMFLGVPFMAVICYILNLTVEHFLNKRKVTVTPYESPDKM